MYYRTDGYILAVEEAVDVQAKRVAAAQKKLADLTSKVWSPLHTGEAVSSKQRRMRVVDRGQY